MRTPSNITATSFVTFQDDTQYRTGYPGVPGAGGVGGVGGVGQRHVNVSGKSKA